jgi:hypothetical protein
VGIGFWVFMLTPEKETGDLHVRAGLAMVSNIKIKNKKIRIFDK